MLSPRKPARKAETFSDWRNGTMGNPVEHVILFFGDPGVRSGCAERLIRIAGAGAGCSAKNSAGTAGTAAARPRRGLSPPV